MTGPGSGAARLQAIVVSGDRAFLVVRNATSSGDDVFVTDGPSRSGIVVPGSRWFLVRAGLPRTTCGEGPTGSGAIPNAIACS